MLGAASSAWHGAQHCWDTGVLGERRRRADENKSKWHKFMDVYTLLTKVKSSKMLAEIWADWHLKKTHSS